MKNRRSLLTRSLVLSAATAALAQPVSAATVTLTASDTAGNSSFNTGTRWSDTTVPSAANDYVVTAGRTLRNVADSTSTTFAGNSLTLGDGSTAGILIFKNAATGVVVTVNNLTLNNGEIQAGGTGGGAANTTTLASNGITLIGTANRLNAGANNRGIIVSAPMSGTGGLVIFSNASTGTSTLTGANTYTGATTINTSSTLNLGNNGTTGSLSPSSAIANSGTLIFRRTDTITQGTDFGTISGTGVLQQFGSGTVVLNTSNAYSGTTTIGASAGAAVLRATAAGALGTGTIQLDSTGNGSTARLELAGNTTLSNATIQLPGRNNTSVGIQNISDSNTLSGTINLQSGGSTYTIQSDAGLLTLSGNIANASGTGTRTLTVTGAGNGVVSGVIGNGTGTTALTKTGAGVWTLSGTNTFTGATAVSAGTLLVNGSLANTAVTVDSGATIGGSGTIAGATTVNGTLAPGNSPGVLTFSGALTLGSTSTSSFEINGTTRGTTYDGVNVGGALTYNGAFSLFFNAPITAGTYDLFGGAFTSPSGTFASVSVGGTFAESFSGSPVITGTGWTASSASWSYAFDNNTGDLAISAIPEPSTIVALAGLAGLSFAGLRRRRSKA